MALKHLLASRNERRGMTLERTDEIAGASASGARDRNECPELDRDEEEKKYDRGGV